MQGRAATLARQRPCAAPVAVRAPLAPVPPTQRAAAKPKLLDQVRGALRSRHYSKRTEQIYVHWIKRFIFFNKLRHPAEMAEAEVNQFLTHLAVTEKVSASTQNQALSALLYLYRYVIDRQLGQLGDVIRTWRTIDTEPRAVATGCSVRLSCKTRQGSRHLLATTRGSG